MPRSRTTLFGLLVVAFFLSFFLLIASGRLASSDAGGQLQAAMRIATAGELGVDYAPAHASGWQQAPNGRYYAPHNLGNILLMLPAAWIGHRMSGATADADFTTPPVLSRVAVSLTCAVVNAITCVFLYWLFALSAPRRGAFLLSLAFATTTVFLPYAKTAWDVSGACCAVSALMYFMARVLAGMRTRDFAAAGAACGVACLFRYSLAPFLFLGVVAVLFPARRDVRPGSVLAFTAGAGASLLPAFYVNWIQTGEFWRPANATQRYLETNNEVTGNIVHGALGLLAAPNRGLLFSAPIFLLVFGLPFVWRRIGRSDRALFEGMGLGAAAYWLSLGLLKNWGGAFSWGPRYLVPVLPILFFGVALAMKALWPRWRKIILTLVAVSVVLNIVPAVVNWSLAIVVYPRALDQDAPVPYQQAAVWRALRLGLGGQPPDVPKVVAEDPERIAGARFPDFWTARLMERSSASFVPGALIALLLLCTSLACLVALTRGPAGSPGYHSGQ